MSKAPVDSSRDVSAIVVCLNGLPWLARCLESVTACETIVVDHGSTDGSLALVRERFPDVQVIEQENVGMGAGNNAGMRIASGRYFLLLNSDAWMAPRRGRATRRPRRLAAGSRRRRAAPAQSRRIPPALRPRVPEPVADRDGVLLPP